MTDDMEFRLVDTARLESLKKMGRNPILRYRRKRQCQNKQINLKEYK